MKVVPRSAIELLVEKCSERCRICMHFCIEILKVPIQEFEKDNFVLNQDFCLDCIVVCDVFTKVFVIYVLLPRFTSM